MNEEIYSPQELDYLATKIINDMKDYYDSDEEGQNLLKNYLEFCILEIFKFVPQLLTYSDGVCEGYSLSSWAMMYGFDDIAIFIHKNIIAEAYERNLQDVFFS